MKGFRSKFYQGKGPEIVWVGEGAEVCALGYECDKYHFMKHGTFDVVSLGIRLGVFSAKGDEKGNLRAIVENFQVHTSQELKPLDPSQAKEIEISDGVAMEQLSARWQSFFHCNTGIRSISATDLPWNPKNYPSSQDLKIILPEPMIQMLQAMGFALEVGDEVLESEKQNFQEEFFELFGFEKDKKDLLSEVLGPSRVYEVKAKKALTLPHPFKLDLGAPLPVRWQNDLLGFSKKEVNGMNPPLVMAYEVVYRALLNACLHGGQRAWQDIFPPEKVGLYLGTGIGPHQEHHQMIEDTLDGKPTRAKALANCITNIACGYISARLAIKGKISTHVGACETCLGSIGDAYRDLKDERMDAAIAGGFDDCMTAGAYNGFTSNMAFTTNERLLESLRSMLDEGGIDDAKIKSHLDRVFETSKRLDEELKKLETDFKEKKIKPFFYVRQKRALKDEKRLVCFDLPKEITRFASMPFSKYRSGFVMGVGGGAGFFTTLDYALEHGLPIRAYLSGVSEMVPDSKEDGAMSIAALGDGVGDAYERAFLESQANYKRADGDALGIEDIGVWFSHGTSTPLNGWGERKEIHRINQKYHRASDKPIIITGDKAEVGHRVAGNFPSLVGYIFATNEVLPIANYLQEGFAPKGRRGFGDALDQLFPSTQIVGPAGKGEGKPVRFEGDFIAVNGAGFGRINTVLMFRRFRLSEIEGSIEGLQEILQGYQDKLDANLKARQALKTKIFLGQAALIH